MSSEGIWNWVKLNKEWEKIEKRVFQLEELVKTNNSEKSDPSVKKRSLRTQKFTHELIAEFSNEIIFRVRQIMNDVDSQLKKYDGHIAHLEEQIELLRIDLNRSLGREKRKQHSHPFV